MNSYTYDANGSAITRGVDSFASDYENRLISVSGGIAATYKYDVQGNRSGKAVGSTTSYLYDGQNLISETNGATTHYLFGMTIDEPLATAQGGGIYYFPIDGLVNDREILTP